MAVPLTNPTNAEVQSLIEQTGQRAIGVRVRGSLYVVPEGLGSSHRALLESVGGTVQQAHDRLLYGFNGQRLSVLDIPVAPSPVPAPPAPPQPVGPRIPYTGPAKPLLTELTGAKPPSVPRGPRAPKLSATDPAEILRQQEISANRAARAASQPRLGGKFVKAPEPFTFTDIGPSTPPAAPTVLHTARGTGFGGGPNVVLPLHPPAPNEIVIPRVGATQINPGMYNLFNQTKLASAPATQVQPSNLKPNPYLQARLHPEFGKAMELAIEQHEASQVKTAIAVNQTPSPRTPSLPLPGNIFLLFSSGIEAVRHVDYALQKSRLLQEEVNQGVIEEQKLADLHSRYLDALASRFQRDLAEVRRLNDLELRHNIEARRKMIGVLEWTDP